MINSPTGVLVPLHGIGTRHDLPLPFSFVVGGAAAALLVSFVVLFVAWRRPRFLGARGIAAPGLTRWCDHPATRWVARLVVLALYAWVGLALFAGEDLLINPVFGFVYAWMWVGLVPLSVLCGPIWRATNPLRTVHRGLCALARIEPGQGLVRLPRGVGVWPAALGIVAFGWLELVQPDRTTLVVLRVWALAWLVILLLGAVVFGSRWIAATDPFEAYATALSRASPIARVPQSDGSSRVALVNPLRNLATWRPPPGAALLVCVLLGNTAFDSFANTTWWIQTSQRSSLSPLLWGTAGLVGMNLVVFGVFCLGAAAMRWFTAADAPSGPDLPRAVAASVVPIAIGYAIAHYATLLIVEGQRTAILISDPLSRGWDVFGTGRLGISSGIFDHPTLVASIQVVAIVGGHVVGIIVAHERSLRLLRPRSAVWGQLPLLAVMVFYTCSGLLLLFSP
ncbi:MAG: hypothetical protein ACR2LI_01280 [Propionibacteriaceae bacterium]